MFSVVLYCSRRKISAAFVCKFASPTPSLSSKVAGGIIYFLVVNIRETMVGWGRDFADKGRGYFSPGAV
jgi:hypothetical protein